MNNRLQQQIIHISNSSEIVSAKRIVKTMALSLGFGEKASEEIVLAVSELGANLVKHAYKGTLTVSPLCTDGQVGIKIESHDTGPGIPDIDQVVADGYSTTGSLGCGLGTVNRLMDEFDITSNVGKNSGTYIVCTRWLHRVKPSMKVCPLEVGAVTRPHLQMSINGDAYIIKKWDESIMAGVIDGLGHGQFAHRASEKARQYLETHCEQPLEELFRGVERSCLATRGVVMALARFDWSVGKLTFASLGNIEARVFGGSNPMNFIFRRGIIGMKTVKPVVTEHTWETGWIMALFSDGIRSHWRWEDFPDILKEPAQHIAQAMLHSLARDNDDATIIIVKERLL